MNDRQRWAGMTTVRCGILKGVGIGTIFLTSLTPLIAQQQPAVAALTPSGTSTDEMLARHVTIHLKNVSLKKAIDSVSRTAKVLVEYQVPLLRAYQKSITMDATAKPLGIVLEQILSGTPLRVVPGSPESLAIVASQESQTDSVPQTGTISGRIIDSATGRGISGATVKIAGTKLAITARDSGRFTLRNVPLGDALIIIRAFGYRPADRSVAVTDGTTAVFRIVLVAAPNVLSGVVTTANGTQRKIEVGNDITTLNVDSVMRVAPITTVTDLLETRVPGLTVLRTSGSPGDPSRIRLRGASSITGNNDPIVVIDGIRVYAAQSDSRNDNLAHSQIGRTALKTTDGVPVAGSIGYSAPSPLDQIDPGSIETIEVLKGPSASALYGSDAANGVIVITTKHGRAGPTQWAANVGFGRNSEPGNWPINYYRFGYGIASGDGSLFCQWYDQTCAQDSIIGFQALNDPRYTVFADHGSDQSYSGSVSGGVPTLQYSLSGSGTGEVGLIKLPEIEVQRYEKFYNQMVPGWMLRPQNYRTWGVSGQVTAVPTAKVRVTLSSSLFNSNQQNSSLQTAINQLDGVYIDGSQLASTPLASQFVERALDHQLTSTNALTLSWQPVAWLQPIMVQGGINTIQRTDQTLIPYGINSAASGAEGTLNINGVPPDTTGSYGLGRGVSQVNTFNVGTGTPNFFQNHISINVGGNVVSTSTSDFTAHTNQLASGVTEPSSFPTTRLDGSLGSPSTFGQTTTSGSTYGVFLTSTIHVLGNLYLNPGFRSDGGSSLGQSVGLTALPKIDLSYVLVDQSHPRGLLTLLRPRLAVGRAETEPGPTERLRLFDGTLPGSLNGDTSYAQKVLLTTIGNTKLQPEQSNEIEGGLDMDVWQDRVSLTWTTFNKTRHNAILSIPLAPSVNGGANVNVNVGVIRETGHEATFNAQVFQSSALGWTIGGNLTKQKSVVVSLNKGQPTLDLGNGTRVQAGYPLFGRWAQPIAAFADANQDGIIEGNEVRLGDSAVYVGQQDPNYQLNINTGLTFLNGRLSLNATFAYENGLTQFNDGAIQSGAFALLANTPGTPLAMQAAVLEATGVTNGTGGYVVKSDKGAVARQRISASFKLSISYVSMSCPSTIQFRLRCRDCFAFLCCRYPLKAVTSRCTVIIGGRIRTSTPSRPCLVEIRPWTWVRFPSHGLGGSNSTWETRPG